MKRWIILIAALAVAFAVGWLLGGRAVRHGISETVSIDTLYFERPQPVSTSDIAVQVNVPKLVFVRDESVTVHHGLDSVVKNNPTTVDSAIKNYLNTDSIPMQVTLRTLEYRDSSYYARVVGPVVGTLAPRLDHIETYNRTLSGLSWGRWPRASTISRLTTVRSCER